MDNIDEAYIYYNDKNRIGGIMVSVLASGAVDRGFEHWSGLLLLR
jgi:hypothetical protein